MTLSLKTIVIERLGEIKEVLIKDFKVEALYKKCGFKSDDNFGEQVEWKVKVDGVKYFVKVYGKTTGRANSENKYDFPPPIDNTLFYGSCIIVAYTKDHTGDQQYVELKLALWTKIYEKLFGGFEDLSATAKEDELEEDELENVPKEKKTKDGYLKDGFVVDSSSDSEKDTNEEEEEDDDDEEDDAITPVTEVEEGGSELSEEEYIEED
jgi:hypothetical protein